MDRWGEEDTRLAETTEAEGAGADAQRVRMLIQPGVGKLDYLPEGAASSATHRGYCNPKAVPSKGAADTDILPDDELHVLDKNGKPIGSTYIVKFVADEGGQGDHFKLLLRTEDGK